MKSVLVIMGCVLGMAWAAVGQGVSVELALDQEQFLVGETLTLKVRITNDSGRNLTMGQDETWLTLMVEDANHLVVSRLGSVPVAGIFTLQPSTTGTKKLDIAPYYDLSRIGRYSVTATISLPQWGQAIQSKAINFDIIHGNSLWEKDFGVPSASGSPDALPEFRRYALVHTSHSRKLGLYFRLTDPRETKVFRVLQLGQIVSFGNLEPQIDGFTNLHVLYQTGGRTFVHCLINPDGVMIARETYEYTASRPTLHAEPDGRVTVRGGARRVGASDLPPPMDPSSPPADAKPGQP